MKTYVGAIHARRPASTPPGSVGRALALCGYGTQFAPELDEIDMRQAGAPGGVSGGRFADSPQPVRPGKTPTDSRSSGGFERSDRPTPPRQKPAATAPANGEDSAQSPETPESAGIAADAQETAAGPACGHCGKALTRSQQELSVRHYGEALCPACQRDRVRQPQTTAVRS